MKLKLIFLLIFLSACSVKTDNISKYHQLVNKAELAICDGNMIVASSLYKKAFKFIKKPFGKDLFNAALVAGNLKNQNTLIRYLQWLVNNLEDYDHLRSTFVNTHISEEEWQILLVNRVPDFDKDLKKEIEEVYSRDQLHRPDYDTKDSLIYANLIINLKWILAKSRENKFPAHQELGYRDILIGQDHHIVLHHAAQRRSYDKNLIDLEPLLLEAVQTGRLDPEAAIQYMIYQNDDLLFQNLIIWQYNHSSLSDSLNSVYWAQQVQGDVKAVDSVRKSWLACSFAEAEKKARYLSENLSSPFMFTSVKKASGNIDVKLNKDDVLSTYKFLTRDKKPFSIKQMRFID